MSNTRKYKVGIKASALNYSVSCVVLKSSSVLCSWLRCKHHHPVHPLFVTMHCIMVTAHH